jgi:hypothetical protein
MLPQIMDAWAGLLVMRDTALLQQTPKSLVDRAVVKTTETLVQK